MTIFKTTSTKKQWPVNLALVIGIGLCLSFANPFSNQEEKQKIVSTNGTVSEILCALGLESNIVGTDITSTYPPSLAKLPKVGHNRMVSAEGVLALAPDLVTGTSADINPQLTEQLKTTHIKTNIYTQEFTVDGAKKLIQEVAASFHLESKGKQLVSQLEADLAKVKKPATRKKVLFIYARGAGTMMVAGQRTAPNGMIQLAGAENAVTDFNDFKPLSAEALVAANPDVILMFESGLKSMGGIDGLLKVQGIAETNAGKNKKVIEMDGQLLTGFGPRLGKAVAELASKL